MCRVLVTRKPNHVGTQLDAKAIHDAALMLGITHPVKIKWDPRVTGSCGGWHTFDGYSHTIDLNPHLKRCRASSTIWHELTHGHQRERDGWHEAQVRYERANREVGYHENPYERQADRVAATFADRHPLVK